MRGIEFSLEKKYIIKLCVIYIYIFTKTCLSVIKYCQVIVEH